MTSFAGPLVALASAATLGTSDFVGGVMSKKHRSVVVTGWSHVGALVVLVVATLFYGVPASMSWLPWAMLGGVCSGLGLVAFYAAMAKGTMGVVSPIAGMGVLVPLVFAMLRGERPSELQMVGIVVAVVGALLAAGPEFKREEKAHGEAIMLASLAGLAFGTMMIAIMMGAQSNILYTQLGMRGTSSTGFIAYALFRRSTGSVSPKEVGSFTALGLLDVMGNVLMATSSTLGMMSITAAVSSLYSVFTIILAAVFLKERVRGIQAVGVVAALLGVLLMNLPH